MASLQSSIALISLIILSLSHLSISAVIDVHDVLQLFKLPKGLLPKEIKNYNFSTDKSSFSIELSSNPCYVTFDDQVVFYDKMVRGKLGSGNVTEISGIQARKFWIWFRVKGVDVDEKDGQIEFKVGFLSQKLPVKNFKAVQSCQAKA